jgi:flagellar hook protein FlgE
MLTSFSTAVSAMSAQETAIDVVGNNLANLNTTGYKAVSVKFRDLVSQISDGGKTQVGIGVESTTTRNFSQGAIQTGGLMTAAIQGSGFFAVEGASGAGSYLYTRDGNFTVDKDGFVTTLTGQKVYSDKNTEIHINTGTVAPQATTTVSADFNLSSDAAVGDTFDVPIQVVDEKGSTHQLTLTMTKTDVDSWTYSADVESGALGTGGGVTITPSSATLSFDSAGKLITGTPAVTSATIAIAGLTDGASDMSVEWNFMDQGTPPAAVITQYASDSKTSTTSQDGYGASPLSEVSIGDDGAILGTYADGRQQTLGQLGLVDISNPSLLQAVGGNMYQATLGTNPSPPGTPATGSILGGKVEGSTVDIATEFTNLMVYQRGYQASSKVITTADQICQDTINLIR